MRRIIRCNYEVQHLLESSVYFAFGSQRSSLMEPLYEFSEGHDTLFSCFRMTQDTTVAQNVPGLSYNDHRKS